MTATCRTENCDNPHDGGRGLCKKCWAAHKRRMVAYGRWDPNTVDPTAALQHVAQLQQWGLGFRQLVKLTGLGRSTFQHLDEAEFIFRSTEAAILAVPVPTSVFDPMLADGTQISSLGSRRRLRALAAIGWDGERVAEMLGCHRHQIQSLTSGRQPKVTVARARKIAELFARLEMTPGPSGKSRNIAQQKGWPKPLQWDEDEIDNPDAVAVATKDKFVKASDRIAELFELGVTDPNQVAERLGIKPDSVKRAIQRAAEADADDDESERELEVAS
ncbi:hypothetical protein SEA_TYPHA_59 [Mycobacterium phage Typha]|uniref:Helix-turn-helix DNA binding domain protein n=1 Tax=Mycobacterium phage Typha TaxID=2517971 RepID=A0A482JAJ3_9CAUD|nr:hypothetical protein KCH40_gp110 [Mycobacterium phage Typha]QBP29714.1 hypothetical protein SEA_TYPHA_59 [Mycobacterium phage Typha]